MDEKIIISSSTESLEVIPQSISTEESREKAISSIKQLFDAENIAYIVYIDDKFDIEGQKEEFKARLKQIKDSGNYLIDNDFETLDWESPIPRFEDQATNLWDNNKDKRKLLHKVCTYLHDEESANTIPALEIESCLGDRIKKLTPNEWVSDEYHLIKSLSENQKALCLFDFQFHNGNDLVSDKNGVQLAQILLEQEDFSNKIICGIFSHTFSEEDEDEYRKKYSKEFNIEPSKFYTISKSRFAFDPKISAFAEGIKNILLLPYVEDLKRQAIDVFQTSNQTAAEKIRNMSPKTFNHIIQKSSLKEGIWEISTLFRLYGILSKEENLRHISDPAKRCSFNNSIKNIRKIDEIGTGYKSNLNNKQLIELRKSEIFLPSDLINPLHLPISNGDIFLINNVEYVLLVQPCNLALRATNGFCGKRAYSYNNGLLVPLKKGDINKTNSPAIEQINDPNLTETIKYADFSSYKNISLDLLDLVVYNISGETILNMHQPTLANDMIHFPWLKRYEYIFKEFTKYEKALIYFNNIKCKLKANDQDIRGLKPFIYAPECLKYLKIDGDDIYDYNNRIFKFKIKRVSRYKSPYSDDLLQKFMLYLSRNSFEHDFTKS